MRAYGRIPRYALGISPAYAGIRNDIRRIRPPSAWTVAFSRRETGRARELRFHRKLLHHRIRDKGRTKRTEKRDSRIEDGTIDRRDVTRRGKRAISRSQGSVLPELVACVVCPATPCHWSVIAHRRFRIDNL
jgi:hypothetical protein